MTACIPSNFICLFVMLPYYYLLSGFWWVSSSEYHCFSFIGNLYFGIIFCHLCRDPLNKVSNSVLTCSSAEKRVSIYLHFLFSIPFVLSVFHSERIPILYIFFKYLLVTSYNLCGVRMHMRERACIYILTYIHALTLLQQHYDVL